MSGENIRDRLRRLRREEPAAAEKSSSAMQTSDTNEIEASRSIDANGRENPRGADTDEIDDRRATDTSGQDKGRLEDSNVATSDGQVSVRGELARRAEKMKRCAPTTPLEGHGEQHRGATQRGLPRDLELMDADATSLLARRGVFARDHRHGTMRLEEIVQADSRAFVLLTQDQRLDGIDLERAIYLDTETSGLAGGSGTYVFMVGLGSFAGERFEVWQGFLDDPAHERSLLAESAARIRAAPAIVSFFGKSFDRHRLEDRMRCLGIDPPFAGKAHLDLYHPLRRLYRGVFADHRLRTLERALCGLERDDDLPGSFAPAAWFDFLAGRPHRLDGVFRHNRDDVLSLVTLAAHLGAVLRADEGGAASDVGYRELAAANLAKAMLHASDPPSALRVCEAALEHLALDARAARAVRVLRAEVLRENGDTAASLQALRDLSTEVEDEHSAPLLLDLARVELREEGDTSAARATCARAALVIARRHTGRELARFERALATLSKRLERKTARAARHPPAQARTEC